MFIVAKRNYLVRRADGSFYRIEKDYIGEIPEDVAESELVQRAIVGGNIAVPGGIRDRELYKAMMRRPSRQQNMISVRTQRNRRRKKTLRSL